MSLPASIASYRDCQSLFEAAAADPKGARAKLGTYEACVGMRTRLHYYRTLDRRANAEIYIQGHPMHGVSVYDDFVVQIIPDEDDQWWVYITPRSAKILEIEGLSEVGDLIDLNPTDVEGHEVHLIEDKTDG